MSDLRFVGLGGTDEVGASSYLYLLKEGNLLIDAGVRPGGWARQPSRNSRCSVSTRRQRSGLGTWNAVLMVRPDMRRQGLGTALQARVCAALAEQGFTFLNTAGVKADRAYLGVLRRLGAHIESDWIAFESVLGPQA